MATAFEGQGPNRDALIVAANTRRVGRSAPAAGVPIARCGSRPHGPCCRPPSDRAAAAPPPNHPMRSTPPWPTSHLANTNRRSRASR